ncbi:prepilin-type N-terminal cleavage/methylation domain-containing protein [Synechocystis sp. FACHB-383]|uniref:prepilin-type N-terminal cleavage/methylation domain-containing protein n=1 Tax=Synechocystis sp. FACHB-383 TaxID=2692864 RepID=UPI001F55353F|nr:prepilin-type N-terminal cleavage/methylation domain-containing protein [Synechocystis sp. FACHB-383]
MFNAISPSFRPRSALLWNLIRQSPSAHHKSDSDGDRGFTMFEVLIALMISFLFLTGTLNAMVMATVMRVKAERQAEAGYWIREDLERVRALAANFNPAANNGCSDSTVGAKFNTASAANSGLANSTNPATTTNTRQILGRNASLSRNTTGANNVLQITYTVRNTEITDADKNVLASLYTEVLPAAALTCGP